MVAEPGRVLDAGRAVEYSRRLGAPEDETELLQQIADRKYEVQSEQDAFAQLCDRWDKLYFPDDVLPHAGASHWAEHPSARTKGKTHVSVNTPPVYVDVPASLQSVTPVENMVSTDPSPEGRSLAAMAERVYFAWKDEEDWDLKCHEACVTKGLYGHTAAKVYWDDDKRRPCVTIVDQPRNLYLGWGSSDYRSLNWSLYVYRQTREQVYESWGLVMDEEKDDRSGNIIPFIRPADRQGHLITTRQWAQRPLEVEVYDYWYRLPAPASRQPSRKGANYRGIKMETWNAIFVGNVMVKNERHPEYEGKIPYVVLFNTFIPGVAGGRPELFDIEPLFREKDERMSDGGQMLAKTVNGQMFQLTGAEAPDRVPPGSEPKPGKATAPGPGNRWEKIEPWMPEFQLEQYLLRLDREMADVSGLNDLLRGMAPSSVLSSSKAITALVANYEARIRIKRDLFYKWRRECWDMAAMIWSAKTTALRPILRDVARLQQVPPSLTPRDDIETANMASNLVQNRLWSQERAMDHTGVDDPESEKDLIRAESTDATLWPDRVQVMAQLMTVLQSLGFATPPQAQQQAMSQAQSLASFRSLLGGGGTPMLNAPEEQAVTPQAALPANAPGSLEAQTMVQGGEVQGRIMSSNEIAPAAEAE